MFGNNATGVIEALTEIVVDVYGKANEKGKLATPPAYLAGVHAAVIEAYEARNGGEDEAEAERRAGIEARAEELRAELADLEDELYG